MSCTFQVGIRGLEPLLAPRKAQQQPLRQPSWGSSTLPGLCILPEGGDQPEPVNPVIGSGAACDRSLGSERLGQPWG
ncbi:hypothetical protein H8959_009962 [Pygathrix nigripes]